MKSKISYFKNADNQLWNKRVWCKDIICFWPLWTLEFLLLQVITTLPLLNQMHIVLQEYNAKRDELEIRRLFYIAVNTGSYVIPIAVVSILAAVLVFGYLNSGRSAYMLHSLPISRGAYFVTHVLSGLFIIFAPFAVTYGILWGIGIRYQLGMSVLVFEYLLTTFLVIIFFYSLACVVVMLSGNGIMSLVIYGVLNVLEMGFRVLLAVASCQFLYIGTVLDINPGTFDMICTPIGGFVLLFKNRTYFRGFPGVLGGTVTTFMIGEEERQQMMESFLSVDWKSLGFSVLSLIISILFLLAAFKLYQMRPLEHVGDLVAFDWCRLVFKAVFCACGSLICVCLLSVLFSSILADITYKNLFFVCAVFMALGCIISYLAGDMILARSFFIWKRLSWLQIVIFCGVMLIVLGANYFISIDRHLNAVPQEKVEFVSLQVNGVSFLYSEEEYERLGLEEIRREIVREGKNLTPAETGREYFLMQEFWVKDEIMVEYEYILDNEEDKRVNYSYPIARGKQEELLQSLEDAINHTDNMAEAVFTAAYESAECTSMELRKRLDDESGIYVEEDEARERIFKAFLKDLQEGKVQMDNWDNYSASEEDEFVLYLESNISDIELEEKNVASEFWWEYGRKDVTVIVTEEMENTWEELTLSESAVIQSIGTR